ncbi:Zinc finger protein ZAT3 [Vitis vinifera]|uniref:Zinc finger protein ZAT3 n=1 Tax=Vitis vinifera TaxID=29760 RepID=A0A438DBR4_VITVI|nr:Zinc finger protein ZAT3 [Vitis vinifera]
MFPALYNCYHGTALEAGDIVQNFVYPSLLQFQSFMDNNPKDSSASSPNRDGQRRSPQHANSGEDEAGGPPPTEHQRPEQHETGGRGRWWRWFRTTGPWSEEIPRRRRGAGPSGTKAKKKPQEFDAPAVASPCSVCGRRFGSWKALFGHMRSHPDRDWRGIHPPPRFNREGTPEGADDDQEPDDNVVREQAENLLLGVAHEVAARLGAAPEPGKAAGEAPGVAGRDVSGSPGAKRADEGGKTETEIGHRCTICSRVFSSGPALDAEPPRSPSSPPPPPPERKEGGLDLNRPPPPSDEE